MLMWRLRLEYFFGADPDVLARRYEEDRKGKGPAARLQ
ncbi:MAG: hypothetical protein QOG83_397 [Alphaproteobacteria bacterium]|nr:hypothetical protein [Alphaproteobacteria bacterium]